MDDLIQFSNDNDAVFTQDDILAIFDPISSSESSSSAVSTPQLSSATSSSRQSRESASKPPRTLPPVSLILRPPRPEDIHLPTPPYVAPIVFPNSSSSLTTNAVTVPPLPSRTQSTFVNQKPNAGPKPPRRRQSLAANAVTLRNSSQTIARRNRISSDRSSSVYSFYRKSEMQEPDSPASALAFKVFWLRNSEKYKWTNKETNPGVVYALENSRISHATEIRIEPSLITDEKLEVFTVDIRTSVAELVFEVNAKLRDAESELFNKSFCLQVASTKEILHKEARLNRLQVVREMSKVQSPLKITVIDQNTLDRCLIRTEADDVFCDSPPIEITHQLNTQNDLAKMAEIENLVAICMGECEKLQNCDMTSNDRHLHLIHVQQAVKALIIQLNEVEIFPISNASIRLAAAVNNSSGPEDVKISIESLRAAISDLVHLYKVSWTDLEHNIQHQFLSSNEVEDPFSLQVISLHQVPENYLHSIKIEYLWIAVSIIRGDRASCCRKSHTGRSRVKKSLFPRVLWDQQLTLNFPISQLPLDATLFIELYGTETVRSARETPIEREHELSSTKIPLFDFKRRLLKGECLFRLEKLHEKLPEPIIYVEFPYHCIQFPEIAISSQTKNPRESSDWPLALKLLESTYDTKNLTDSERQLIWRNRSNAMRDLPESLPFILRCVDNWNAETLSEVSGLLSTWPSIKPLIALSLLTKEFISVQFVRDFAINSLKHANESVLLSILTQLVSLLQYEKAQDGVLAVFLLEKAWKSIRLTFHLHAALITAADHTAAPIFYVMRDLLEWSSGSSLKSELAKTQKVLNIINFTAEQIKEDRSNYLVHFESLWTALVEFSPFRLAEFPTVEFNNIVVNECKPFSSFTAPLLLTLEGKNGEKYSSIYKNGDDLRQDLLVTSLFQMMENFWLSQGLDLRMLGYKVYPTAKNCGFIEIVKNSVTLRQVQVGNNQKERCLHDWLAGQRNNKFELIDNFTRSCSAYSVATYILGLGDRHNDNIMLTRRGHMFHIDFNKAFGHYQKIGGVINRDRAPFVLSDDMVLVINHGATMETGRKFPAFVLRCTEAYNIARHHWREIISMIMVSAPMNMTALKEGGNEVQVVFENLSPTIDDIAAQEMFFNRVKKSITSVSTRINFFMHTFAQLFQTGGWDGVKPLPDPMKYTVQEVGRPIDFEIEGFEMQFRPQKMYLYRLRVRWPNRMSFILRSWIEFTQIRSVIEKYQIERGGELVPVLGKAELSARDDRESVAIARKSAIFDFLQFANAEAQVRDHPATITFLYEDERRPPAPVKSNSIPNSSRQGMIKYQMLFEMQSSQSYCVKLLVKNCFDLPSIEGRAPESYVKVYIRDESGNNIKNTKQKTTTEYSHNPVFNKVFYYDLEDIPSFMEKKIEISVWNYSGISASNFMIGRVLLPLKEASEGYLELLSP